MEIFTSIPAICLYAVIAAAVFLWIRYESKKPVRPGVTWVFDKEHRDCPPVTMLVEQLDEDCDTVLHYYCISMIPWWGVTISRTGAKRGDIMLCDEIKAAWTVSQEHARISRNIDGFYIQEREGGTINGMFLGDSLTKIEEASITDGMIIYLGEQPIRFWISPEKLKRFRGYIN